MFMIPRIQHAQFVIFPLLDGSELKFCSNHEGSLVPDLLRWLDQTRCQPSFGGHNFPDDGLLPVLRGCSINCGPGISGALWIQLTGAGFWFRSMNLVRWSLFLVWSADSDSSLIRAEFFFFLGWIEEFNLERVVRVLDLWIGIIPFFHQLFFLGWIVGF